VPLQPGNEGYDSGNGNADDYGLPGVKPEDIAPESQLTPPTPNKPADNTKDTGTAPKAVLPRRQK
jgi:hypothetical protein